MDKNTILSLLEQIKQVEKSGEGRLPQNSFYLDYDKVVCCKREVGDSRYPYDRDGLMVWLHSTGFIDALEGKLNVFKTANYGEESAVSFFAGIKNGEDDYTPVSVTGASRQTVENNVSRYIVYSLKCAYCITECSDAIFALRLHVDSAKHIHFSLMGINTSDKPQEFYLASFMEAILRYNENEGFWDRLRKFGKRYPNGTVVLKSVSGAKSNSIVINSKITEGSALSRSSTTARGDFLGSKGLAVANAESLRSGYFKKQATNTSTTDLPVAADIFRVAIPKSESVRIDYELVLCYNDADIEKYTDLNIDKDLIDDELCKLEAEEKSSFDNLRVRFNDWNTDKVDAETFSKFYRSVQKQVTICAHGKNYAGPYLGVRDVFQQLEAALIWNRDVSRQKIVSALNYILTTGRPPRQFALLDDPTAPVPVTLEKYIDQGVWIISTVYTYLAYTDDYSILDEVCGYIEADDNAVYTNALRSEQKDTVLEHLIKIMNYLFSQVDREAGTNCIKVLFGDWNDALDGLGKSENGGFGSGVTVMATLQFYQNCKEMIEILQKVGGYDDLCKTYADAAKAIETGLEQNAIVTNENGERKIVHGWGDKISYKVGSWCDPDGASRYSLTSNAFWAITKFLKRDPSLKESIMNCINAVSSKYGLKTFDVPFPADCKGVGRIAAIVPGTYENSCAYAHCSLFGTMALFEMGESKRAWEEILKTAVITHDNCTMSTFVMPNSYCENAEYGMDGESMGDWHTGSGAVLAKETVRYGFGIYPDLDGVRIQTAEYFPAKSGEITVNVKDSEITLIYENKNNGKRTAEIIGADDYSESFDDMMNIPVYYLPKEKMGKKITVKICD